ncbi:MAG: hypothetical protein P8X79_13015 [Reinekea sp.]
MESRIQGKVFMFSKCASSIRVSGCRVFSISNMFICCLDLYFSNYFSGASIFIDNASCRIILS